jgi:hypothetical protein
MRVLNRTGLLLCGLSLATSAALTVPDLGLSATRAIGRPAGKVGVTRAPRQRPVSRPFIPSGIIAVGGDSEPQIIIIQPPPPPPVVGDIAEPAAGKTYVPSRWVDGGHGVQVLEHGHWVEAKPAAKR